MKKIIISSLLSFFAFSMAFAQNLQLEKDGKIKSIKPGSFLFMSLVNDNMITPELECGQIDVSGKLLSVEKDSIELSLSSFDNYITVQNTEVRNYFDYPKSPFNYKIPKSSITSLYNYKSQKQKIKKENKNLLGGVLIMTGTITGLTYLFTKSKSENKHIIIAAGAMLTVGIPIAAATSSKEHVIDNTHPNSWIIK